MIACYAQNGLFEVGLGLLRDMKLSGLDVERLGAPSQKTSLLGGVAQILINP